jgi:hypothetical protein
LAEETEELGENLPNAALSTTNSTKPELGSNPGLSYSTAKASPYFVNVIHTSFLSLRL